MLLLTGKDRIKVNHAYLKIVLQIACEHNRLEGAILTTRQFLNVKDTIKQYGSFCRCDYTMCEQFLECESFSSIFNSCILQNVRERVQERR